MPIININATEAKRLIDAGEAVLVDVREPAEFHACRIEGANLVPLGTVCCSALPHTSEDKKLIVHCQAGRRGMQACETLQKEDDSRTIYHITGGLNEWQQAGLPITRSKSFFLPLDRQVQLTIGLMLIAFSLLAFFFDPAYALACTFLGGGLTMAGLTGLCGLARIMAKMPWNQA